MANDFDQFPVYDALIKSGTLNMSDVWRDFIGTFYMNLIAYLTHNGMLIPQITTAERDAIKSPQLGQMIYNTTSNQVQVWQFKISDNMNKWRTVTTTP